MVGLRPRPGDARAGGRGWARSTAAPARSRRPARAPRSSSARRRWRPCRSWRARRSPPAGPRRVVTDVGSTKRELVAALGDDERFIGGHPLAGAETAGVENARADLFEGARWYLTPTERSSGVLYDRLQRAVAGLGARPQAIDAEAHDRLMATVSHLPHVVANVLVGQAAAELTRDSERMPEVGPSFRDTTRVAGSNPAIWGDIFASNREAVADGDRGRRRAGCARRRELIRGGDREAVAAWHAAAAEDRRRLLEAELAGGPLRELRVVVANRPGTVAELALALGEAGVNIEDMALHPAPDMTSGAVSLWVAGDEQAERAAALVRELGHTVTVLGAESRAMTRFDPSGPLRGALRPPPDKSISHRAALIAAMGEGETAIEGYLDSADTRSTLAAVAGARRRGRGRRRRGVDADDPRSAASACAAPARRASTSATPAPCCGCCRAGWRGRRRAPGRSTATTRSGAGRSTGSPSRCG